MRANSFRRARANTNRRSAPPEFSTRTSSEGLPSGETTSRRRHGFHVEFHVEILRGRVVAGRRRRGCWAERQVAASPRR